MHSIVNISLMSIFMFISKYTAQYFMTVSFSLNRNVHLTTFLMLYIYGFIIY